MVAQRRPSDGTTHNKKALTGVRSPVPDVPPLSLENIRALQHSSYVSQLYPNSRSTYPRRSSRSVFTAISEVFIPILLEMSQVHFFYYFLFFIFIV